MDETVEELTRLHKEKWAGLITMDKTLKKTFIDSEAAKLKAID